ncbi:MAG: hypothetical protein IJR66_05715 [Clostridia bacterium]|nr:hypothetical protein [Clostridia bacterium]
MSGNKTVIALGLFDCLHAGHKKVIEKAVSLKKDGLKVSVFSFSSLPFKPFGDKMIYPPEIRKEIMLSLGVDEVSFYNPTAEFLSQSKEDFLSFLNKKYDIYAYVIGEDYTFGKNREGNAEYLKKYAKEHGQKISVVKLAKKNGEKISSTLIKEYLKAGEIKKANALLKSDYKIEGVIKADRKVGKKLLFPTVNIKTDDTLFPVKTGVYYGYVILDKNIKR